MSPNNFGRDELYDAEDLYTTVDIEGENGYMDDGPQEPDPGSFVPSLVLFVLLSCIILCILSMISILLKRRADARAARGEPAAVESQSHYVTRTVENVVDQSGKPLGKMVFGRPIIYSVNLDPIKERPKVFKVPSHLHVPAVYTGL